MGPVEGVELLLAPFVSGPERPNNHCTKLQMSLFLFFIIFFYKSFQFEDVIETMFVVVL